MCHPSFKSTFSDHAEFRQQLGTSILRSIDTPDTCLQATSFLSYVFYAVVGATHSIPDLRSYVLENILIDGQWGDIFVALSILLIYPELKVNIHVISCSMEGDNNLPLRFVEIMNIGYVLRDLYDEQHHNSTFIQFLSYDIDTCEQLYLLLGNSYSPFVQATSTMQHNHYYYLKKIHKPSFAKNMSIFLWFTAIWKK